ncbi:MAG: chromosomal replication initiator protein DnaA, partial [Pseudomonadota bacterium]
SISLSDLQKFSERTNNNNLPNYFTTPLKNNCFEKFIIGPSNQLAYSCALNMAESLCQETAPQNHLLLIYGKPGLGKTHLLESIYNYVCKKRHDLKVVLLTAENFARDFIESLNQKSIKEFKRTIRNTDLLLIDDIHFMSSKNSTQEEFLHTLNDLLNRNSCIVMTSLYMPKNIQGLSNSICSRLAGALCAGVKPLNVDLTKALIKAKAHDVNLEISEDVCQYLAQNMGDDVRPIEGNIATLAAQSNLLKRAVTIDLCQQTLHTRTSIRKTKATSIESIQRAVSGYYNIPLSELSSARRSRSIVRPRHVAMYLAKELTLRSLPEIGRMFGKRDHSTVHHAINQIDHKRKRDPELEASIRELIFRLESDAS